jgi:hypothetical protein
MCCALSCQLSVVSGVYGGDHLPTSCPPYKMSVGASSLSKDGRGVPGCDVLVRCSLSRICRFADRLSHLTMLAHRSVKAIRVHKYATRPPPTSCMHDQHPERHVPDSPRSPRCFGQTVISARRLCTHTHAHARTHSHTHARERAARTHARTHASARTRNARDSVRRWEMVGVRSPC